MDFFPDSYSSICDQEKQKFSQLKLSCLLNLSAVQLQIQRFKDCLDVCEEVRST